MIEDTDCLSVTAREVDVIANRLPDLSPTSVSGKAKIPQHDVLNALSLVIREELDARRSDRKFESCLEQQLADSAMQCPHCKGGKIRTAGKA